MQQAVHQPANGKDKQIEAAIDPNQAEEAAYRLLTASDAKPTGSADTSLEMVGRAIMSIGETFLMGKPSDEATFVHRIKWIYLELARCNTQSLDELQQLKLSIAPNRKVVLEFIQALEDRFGRQCSVGWVGR